MLYKYREKGLERPRDREVIVFYEFSGEVVGVFLCSFMCQTRGSEVMVELVKDNERVVQVIAVSKVNGRRSSYVTSGKFGLALGHPHLKLWRCHLIMFAQVLDRFFGLFIQYQMDNSCLK